MVIYIFGFLDASRRYCRVFGTRKSAIDFFIDELHLASTVRR